MAWRNRRLLLSLTLMAAGGALSACGLPPPGAGFSHLSERDCMARVMFFESNRSSSDGMVAVGTVVMNRRSSGQHPRTVCGVVGERNQFADGALWKRMSGPGRERAYQAADAVLAGERHAGVGSAMYFHTADRWYPYSNMHYVAVAGGNAFYEKRSRSAPMQVAWNRPSWNRPVWNRPAWNQPPPTATPVAAPVAERGSIDATDRVRLANFLNTGQGLY